MVKALLNPDFGWNGEDLKGVYVCSKGAVSCVDSLVELVGSYPEDFFAKAQKLLEKEYEHFACIIETYDRVFACVDWCRSHPVFYGVGENEGVVSNCAYTTKKKAKLDNPNDEGVLEFSLAGYVTGRETVYENLFQLQAGECLVWDKKLNEPEIFRYYRYVPAPADEVDEQAKEKELGEIVDNMMHRAIKTADGAPLWMPLSGGLDSRLLLAKLVEFGYKNIQTFSYGVKSNHEVITAKRIAAQLGVPWFELPAEPEVTASLWDMDERTRYEKRADGLSSCPSYLDYEAFYKLVKDGKIPSEAVIINGQSGDYITGAHLPASLHSNENPTMEDLFAAVRKKHFSLWDSLKDKPENIEIIERRVKALLPELPENTPDYERICTYYESWEWQERQAKLVVNGQRVYDHFGFKWVMPLWDGELMNFWETMPFSLKKEQNFHIRYLQNYNYKGVFDTLRDEPQTWTPKYKWIPWVARAKGLVGGQKAKEAYYDRMYYYSTYNDQYGLLGQDYHLKNYEDARGVVSYFSDRWLADRGLPYPTEGRG